LSGLEKLTIRAKEDEIFKEHPHPLEEWMGETREDILWPIFANELRTIGSLKRLEVYGKYEWEWKELEFADATVAWFEDREKEMGLREL